MNTIKVGPFSVGKKSPCLIMVDAGVNHNNSIDRGLEIIDQAANSGANIIKFQTYKAHTITTKTAPRYWSEKLNTDSGGSQFDTFSRLDGMSIDGYFEFKKRCTERNVVFSSTPFNLPDVELLENIGMDIYKISSSDITYLDLINEAAQTGKPIIISTGCATIGEIEKAISVVQNSGNNKVILQHCILQYPCDDENANLEKMVRIQEIFPEIPVGYSDHTIGNIIPAAAVALGALTVEKHFTIDKKLPDSPDHSFSADTEDLKNLVRDIRRIELGRGIFISGHYQAEEKAWKFARKSIVSLCSIRKGTVITKDMLTCKRPGTGIYPEYIEFIIGSTANVDIPEDTTITKEMLS